MRLLAVELLHARLEVDMQVAPVVVVFHVAAIQLAGAAVALESAITLTVMPPTWSISFLKPSNLITHNDEW
jgi:hypothetical protein